jgi:hypothetical protein
MNEVLISSVTGFSFIHSDGEYRFYTEDVLDDFLDYACLSDRQTKRLCKALDTYDRSKTQLLVYRNADETRLFIKELDIAAHNLEDCSFYSDDEFFQNSAASS